MFEIPFKFILVNPFYDFFVITFILYFFVFKFYKILLENDRYQKITWLDTEISIIFFIFAYLNYYGMTVNFFGNEISWFLWVGVVLLLTEGFYIVLYWKDVKKWLSLQKKWREKKTEEILEKNIQDLNFIKEMMEEEKSMIENINEEKAKKRVLKLEKEIKKIDSDIKGQEEDLRKLRKIEKND